MNADTLRLVVEVIAVGGFIISGLANSRTISRELANLSQRVARVEGILMNDRGRKGADE